MSQGPPQVCDTFIFGKILEYPVVSVLACFVAVCMADAYHGYNFSLLFGFSSLIVTLLCCLFSSLWPLNCCICLFTHFSSVLYLFPLHRTT